MIATSCYAVSVTSIAANAFCSITGRIHPVLGVAYRLKEAFYGIYDARARTDAEARYAASAAQITPAIADKFKPLTTAWKNWHPEILNYFDHRITNAYTESLNALIRQRSRAGRGYSFEALRAKMLYIEGLHKIEKPKFERRAMSDFASFMVHGHYFGLMTPVEVYRNPINYGTDLPTLVRRLESGTF
jgi:transposase